MIFAKIDRKKKILGTILLRALGYNTREQIIRCFYTTEEVPVKSDNASREKLVDRILASAVILRDKDTNEEKRLFNAGIRLHPHEIDDLIANGVSKIVVIKFDTRGKGADEKNESLNYYEIGRASCRERV